MASSHRLAAAFLLARSAASARPSFSNSEAITKLAVESSEHTAPFFNEFLGFVVFVLAVGAVVMTVRWALGSFELESWKPEGGCRWCSAVLVVSLVSLSWVFLRIATAECTIDSFDASLLLPENAVAAGMSEQFERCTVENTPDFKLLDLDLYGIWWMDGNPLAHEQLISFAGATGKPPYPSTVMVPFSDQRRWTWTDDFIGRGIVFYYSLTAPADAANAFQFQNSSSAHIAPVGDVFGNEIFGFEAMNADEWDRVDTYTLRRVINEDGSKGAFWDKFEEWYKGRFGHGRVIVQASNNGCKRRCQYFSLCSMCNIIC